jgi:hypothetical protein
MISGFEKSSFVYIDTSLATFMKDFISKIINESFPNKKQSFCTGFDQMMINFQGLFGFEFSKQLLIIFGLKKLVYNLIRKIESVNDYRELKNLISNIHDLLNVGNVFEIDSLDINILENESVVINRFEQLHYSNSVEKFFNDLFSVINKYIERKTIVDLEINKKRYSQYFMTLYSKILIINDYEVSNIDQLCISLGIYDRTYGMSFLKMYDMIYEESLSDCIPYRRNSYKPYSFIQKYNLKYDELLENFMLHYNKVFDDTYKIIINDFNQYDIVKIRFSDNFINHLAEIELNIFVNLAQFIADDQLNNIHNNKSSRIHFDEVFSKIIILRPRCTHFSNSQRTVIDYILKNTKELNESNRSNLIK